MKDTAIKAGTYCPVCRGIVGSDCWHEASEFRVPRTDFKSLDLIDQQAKEIAELKSLAKKMADALEGVLTAHRLTLKRPADTMDKIENELQTIRDSAAKADKALSAYRELIKE